MGKRIKNVLISVSDKSNLFSILKIIKKYKINIISSGGTFREIKKLKFKCKEISEFTNFQEMLDGRVKTLHPKIHSGILFDRSKKKHVLQMEKKGFVSIDMVITNFYPFLETLKTTKKDKEIIENIDIGGPAMVRASAKNFKNVTVITDVKDYSKLIDELKKHKGKTSEKFREKMAAKAFSQTAFYDSVISGWFDQKLGIVFPEKKTFFGNKLEQLRYGENPHQKSSIYLSSLKDDNLGLKQINGKNLSFNNYNDIFAGLEILYSEKKLLSTVIIKHANPCGVSCNKSSIISFKNAMLSDPVSAFGGIVACNYRINTKIASEMYKTFFEVIMAKGFEKKALRILKKKKNMRIIDITKFKTTNNVDVRNFGNSFLLQDKNFEVYDRKKLKFVTKLKPSSKELEEIEFAFRMCKFVKSNAIVITNNKSVIGVGAGQQNRLDSCKIATQKARKFQPEKLHNSVAASDAFFPFADGIKTLINAGVKIIVQPGGSIRDKEVIQEANNAGIKMVFTGTRHFNH